MLSGNQSDNLNEFVNPKQFRLYSHLLLLPVPTSSNLINKPNSLDELKESVMPTKLTDVEIAIIDKLLKLQPNPSLST